MNNYSEVSNQHDVRAFDESFAQIMRNVYAWMAGGLLTTALTAMVVANSPILLSAIFSSQISFWAIIIAQVTVVWILASRIMQMSFLAAGLTFAGYSILTGLTMSSIFVLYTSESIAQTFFISAGVFGAMSIVGMVTKKDLSLWGRILFQVLIGLIIATVVNLFLHNSVLYSIINYVGVVLFVALTAYDTQKIKQMAMAAGNDDNVRGKVALWGSLTLYLDFINLFLYILRIFGSRK